MFRMLRHPLLLLLAALALTLAACNGNDVTADPDDAPADDGVDTEEAPADDTAAADMPLDDLDLQPADGETILDVLTARGGEPATEEEPAEDDEAVDPQDEDADEEAAEEAEDTVEEDAEPTYATFVEAVEAADLGELFDAEGPWTVFAPTDDAFALYPADSLQELLGDQERLRRVLAFHVVEGEVTSDQLEEGDVETLAGETLMVRETAGGAFTIDGADVVEADLEAGNGVAHGISALLLPPPADEAEDGES
jgi:uncharacterized surface protein with fasciclin (FAS1) repeats